MKNYPILNDRVLEELIVKLTLQILFLVAFLFGYGLLVWIDWRIALAVYSIHFAINLGNHK